MKPASGKPISTGQEESVDEHNAIAQIKRGNIDGLAALVQQYQVSAVRVAYLITGDRAMAEDVVQTSFIQAYQRIHQYDTHRPFAPWFLRSVANAAIKAASRGHPQVSLDSTDNLPVESLSDPVPDPLDALEAAEVRQAIRAALAVLSPEQRAVIVLRYYLEMSEQDMAEMLNCPPGTVKWRLHAARQRLRGLLRPLVDQAGGES